LVLARNIVVHFARRLTDLSYAEIGRALGGRDHTTVMHADRRLAEQIGGDARIQQIVEELERLLG
jgi:chromosomal replication initiator protein